MKPFIITLTGPSACGKGLITNEIIQYSKELQAKGIKFNPFLLKKDVTRQYRISEAVSIILGSNDTVDVKSVPTIPSNDNLVYRTYGDEYAIDSKSLDEAIKNKKTPIVVINDVRVVEEIKRLYKGRVLSLFIFRDIIPDIENHMKTNASRGGVSKNQVISRYEKAVALYRVFIENIYIFDRVVLNVGDIELAKTQARGLIDGVISGKISLNKVINKGPKLFIISGNAASGKDDIIQAAKNYGKQQTDILIKTTSRWEEMSDEGEILCQYVPSKSILQQLESKTQLEWSTFENHYTMNSFEVQNHTELCKKYDDFIAANPSIVIQYEQFIKALYNMKKMEISRSILSAVQRFWALIKDEQDKRKIQIEGQTKKELPENEYHWILNHYFEQNKSPSIIDIDKIRSSTKDQQIAQEKLIEDKNENKSWFLEYDGNKYVMYENNLLYGKPIKYGFEIGQYIKTWNKRKKHLVLTASLPNLFKICREQFGNKNVITAFTYSQISAEEHEKNHSSVTGAAKTKEYHDIVRYANHIADFDYALIYAETSLTNYSGNQKDELIDQMFRLFRVYNK